MTLDVIWPPRSLDMKSRLRELELLVMHSVEFLSSSMNTRNSIPSDTQLKSRSSKENLHASSSHPAHHNGDNNSKSSLTYLTNATFSRPIPQIQMSLLPPSVPCGDNSVPSTLRAATRSNPPAGQRLLAQLTLRRRGCLLVNLLLRNCGGWIIR